MIVPTYVQEKLVDEQGEPTPGFVLFIQNLIQNMQLSVSDEGYLIPSVSSANNSVTPSAAGGQLAILQASYQNPSTPVNPNTQTVTVGVQVGTIIFDPYELNGGAAGPPRVPKGQLKVLLNDGLFHPIVNT